MRMRRIHATKPVMPGPRSDPSGRSPRLDLAGLVDLEAQLAEDEQRPERELDARDRLLGRSVAATSSSRRELLAAWVDAIRSTRKSSPGLAFARAYRRASLLFSLSMLVVGAVVAFGIFHFTGDHPINVLVVLGVFVFAQLLTLLIGVLALAIAVVSPGLFESLPPVALLKGLTGRLWHGAKDRFSDDRMRLAFERLLTRRSLYRRVERHVLFRYAQLGAAWFNGGALAVLLVDVTVTDLAFGWSTTLQLGADSFHELCQALAAPWSSWLPEAVPSIELVRATQYFRLEGAYVGAGEGARAIDPAMAGQWWAFLASCLAFYGLLPRVVLCLWSSLMIWQSLRTIPLDTPDIDRLVARLAAPSIRRAHGEDPGNVAPLGSGFEAVRAAFGADVREDAHGVLWRDAQCQRQSVLAFLENRYHRGLQGRLRTAGGSDFTEDERVVDGLEPNDRSPVVVVSEPWTVPDASLRRFVESLRTKGKERPIVFVLTEGGSEEDAAIWEGYLAELRDPYVYFERDARISTGAAR